MKRVLFALLCALMCFTSACGYTFVGGGSVLPADVKRIYIPLTENETTEANLARIVTEALQDRFERYGVVEVVDKMTEADAVLKTKIISVTKDTKTSTSGTDTALQYDIKMVISAELQRVTGQILWSNRAISAAQTYGATGSVVVTSSADFALSSLSASDLSGMSSREVARSQESEALDAMAEKVARAVYDQAVAPEF
ncbi:MAG: LPS assembly lipoprotein LptE [Bdellovibrionota bacterium]|jgi:outer membrane lipopolysaccharide assembly protein LptE/RlpB